MTAEAAALTGQDTLISSWRALAATSPDAGVARHAGSVVAVFPHWIVLNNAILLDDVTSAAATAAALRRFYLAAGVDAWALWLPNAVPTFAGPDVTAGIPGMVRDATTLVMHRELSERLPTDRRVVGTSVAAATRATDEPVPVAELPEPDPRSAIDAWVLVADGFAVAGAWSHLHDADCGLYAVGTVMGWRRRGLAGALTRHVLADAYDRGARTASLQSTDMGERLYSSLGFTAVGRYEEWVPLG